MAKNSSKKTSPRQEPLACVLVYSQDDKTTPNQELINFITENYQATKLTSESYLVFSATQSPSSMLEELKNRISPKDTLCLGKLYSEDDIISPVDWSRWFAEKATIYDKLPPLPMFGIANSWHKPR